MDTGTTAKDGMMGGQDRPVGAPSPAQARLEKMSSDFLIATGESEKTLQELYLQMAQEAAQQTPSEELSRQVEQELESLRRTTASLRLAVQNVAGMLDELWARFRDMNASVDRKWYKPNPPANAAIDWQEEETHHFARGINLYKLLLVCIVGSFAGVVIEMLWCLVTNGYIESRAGLVYGPFNLLYGVGAVAVTAALYRYRNRGRWLCFLGGMIAGSVVEYVCSWAQELAFGSRSWDYSDQAFNLNGRICLLYSIFWGFLGILWIKDIYPRMAKWILKIPNQAGKILTWALTVFLIINAAVSCVAVFRWAARVNHVPPSNSFWQMMDERFPNERMQQIYANMTFG